MQIDEQELFDEEPKVEKNSIGREILSILIYTGVIIGLTWLILTFVGQRTKVEGNSMYPTLYNEDNLLVDKLSYRFKPIERFDIIVFEYPHDKDTHYIKRVIGLPGETVQIVDGKIYINGEVLDENYGYETMRDAKRAAEPITLGEDEYFVLGDNRNDSSDSRSDLVGNVKKSQIVGKAFVRIYPFNRICILKHQ